MQVLEIFLELFLLGLAILATTAAVLTDEHGRSLRGRWENQILCFLAAILGTALATGLVCHLFIWVASWITGIPV